MREKGRKMTGEEYKKSIRDHLRNAYMLNDEKIRTFLPQFLNTLLTHLDNLQAPLQANNLSEMSKAGHTLKGALLNLGLSELAEIAYNIELQGKARHTTADYQAMLQQLQREIRSFAGQ
jgi:HPt (histidine-containing phosphotransfer) domain-containing protein